MKAIHIKGCRMLLVQKTLTNHVSIDGVLVGLKPSCALNKQHTALLRCYFPHFDRI